MIRKLLIFTSLGVAFAALAIFPFWNSDAAQSSQRTLPRQEKRSAGRALPDFDIRQDDQGGFVRFYDVADLIHAAAPMYVKLGVRNAPNIYPTGAHITDLGVRLGRERVRRAELCMRLVEELAPKLMNNPRDDRPTDLAIPEAK